MKKFIFGSIKKCASVIALVALFAGAAAAAPLPGGDLDPLLIPKYVQPLVIPPEMPKSNDLNTPAADYNIAVRQFKQQILPGGVWNAVNGRTDTFGATTLWSYGRAEDVVPAGFTAPVPIDPNSPLGLVGQGVSFNYPSFTIETISQPGTTSPTKIRWINDLVDGSGNYLQHLFSVDQTLHWANPGKDLCRDGSNRTDCATNNPDLYDGPVPIVTHVHGAHVNAESDGYPEAWWLPAANNLPAKYLDANGNPNTGTIYTQYDDNNAVPGSAFYAYENDQPAATLWYHDHSLGMTRLNVYAGPAGFYLVRGGDYDGATDGVTGLPAALPGPAPSGLGDPNFDPAYRSTIREVPIAIQDRSFNADGSLFYPDSRAFFDGYQGPYTGSDTNPTADIAPIWNPEAFFNTMVVNGTTWPVYNVAPERYRLRLLNGCNSRFLNLSMFVVNKLRNGKKEVLTKEVPFYQIGAEQGFLPQVVEIQTGFATPLPGDGTVPLDRVRGPFKDQALLMGPAERADVIVDFSQFKPGTVIRMINTAPDAPFGGFPDVPADPSTTGQIMEFVVGMPTGQPDPSTPVHNLVLNAEPTYNLATPAPNGIRDLSLNEGESEHICVTVDPAGNPVFAGTIANPIPDILTACATLGAVPMAPKEALLGGVTNIGGALAGTPLTWSDDITENPQVGDTETWDIYNFTVDGHPIHLHLVRFQVEGRQPLDLVTNQPIGVMAPAQAAEQGWKDTVIAYPGEVTRIRATFDKEGLYVWHCHIVEHEDNEMMRPYYVGDLANSPVP